MARGKRKKARDKKQHASVGLIPDSAGKKQAAPAQPGVNGEANNYAMKAQSVHLQRKSTEEDIDPFRDFYRRGDILEPQIPFSTLREIREACDVLSPCRKAYLDNIYRAYDFDYLGDDAEKESVEAKERLATIKGFLRRVNSRESLLKVLKRMGGDKFDYGNGFIEVQRTRNGQARWFFYCSATFVRLTKLDVNPTKRTVILDASGSTVEIDYYFRRFVRIDPATQQLIYFKEFGDKRAVDRTTGDYLSPEVAATMDPQQLASEIWWFKNDSGGSPYGLPDWWSAIVDSKGRYTTRWINFDTVDSGGLPPVIFAYKNGTPPKGTQDMIEKAMDSWRDPGVYNAPCFMTIDSNLMLDPSTGTARGTADIEVIKMRDDRSEEYMFPLYRKDAKDSIRQALRLPPLYIGAAEDYTSASAYASIEIGEALFEPFRNENDEQVNIDLVQNELKIFDWQVRTLGSRISDKETYYKAASAISRTGGPSINHMIDAGNELFGTQWSRYDDPLLSAQPAMVISKMIAAGMLTLDQKTNKLKLVEQVSEGGADAVPAALKSAGSPLMCLIEAVNERLDVSDDALELSAIMGRIRGREVENFEPPVHTEDDYQQ